MIVFLDTEVFEHENYNFESRKLKSLMKCIEHDILKLYMTQINIDEIKKRIDKKVNQAEVEHKAIRKQTLILQNSRRYCESVIEKSAYDQYKHELLAGFDAFLKESKTQIIPIQKVDLEDIFEAYFGDKPPFNTEKKKHEFPDAISIKNIYTFIHDKKDDFRIISGDSDVKSLIETLGIKRLAYHESLESFLDEVLPNAQVKEYLIGNKEFLRSQIENKFKEVNIHFEEDFYNSEERRRDFIDVEIYDYSIIDSDGEIIYLQLKADISYEVSIAYNDPDGFFWDSEDKDYIYVGDTKVKNLKNAETVDIEIECEKLDPEGENWSIYVLDFELSIDVKDFI